MRRLGEARRADLSAVIAATLLALFVALLADSGPIVAAAMLPLVLFLPGFAIAAALFPPATISHNLRAVLSIALSIAATALSGLILQVGVDLDRGVVAISLAAIAIGASLAAWRQRSGGPSVRLRIPSRPTQLTSAASAVALVVAVGLAGWAVSLASDGARSQMSNSHFSELWMLPREQPDAPPGSSPLVVVGVSNQEGRPTGYQLSLQQDGIAFAAWSLRLAAGGEWQRTVPSSALPASGSLVAVLHRGGKPYRRVAVELEAPPEDADA